MDHILLCPSELWTLGNGISKNILNSKKNIIIVTGNLLAKNFDTDSCKHLPYNYFLDRPPFQVLVDETKILDFDIKKKVLCYNRKPSPHRKILCYHVLNSDLLIENFCLSLGIISNGAIQNKDDDVYRINFLIDDINFSNEINNFYKKFDFDIIFNKSENLENQNLGSSLNFSDYQQTFCSLVTETDVNKSNLFISEKTYKPIYAQQPFLILGNPKSLEYLKKIGFKTFNDWWDESYDNELDFNVRLKKILKIIEDICSRSLRELNQIRTEMSSILIHNYRHFLTFEAADFELKKIGYGKFKHFDKKLL